MSLSLRKEVIDIVESRYEILDIINLFEYDSQLDKLDQLLSKYDNYTFSFNQRILITHDDTDYYISNSCPGFTLYNIFVLLHKHSIPHEFLIIFTNHYGIEDEVTQLSAQICNSDPPKVIYTLQWGDRVIDFSHVELPSNQLSKVKNLFCCLNGVNREHRLLTLCYLKEHNLLNQGIVSYHFT
jgi:hypothetical protein